MVTNLVCVDPVKDLAHLEHSVLDIRPGQLGRGGHGARGGPRQWRGGQSRGHRGQHAGHGTRVDTRGGHRGAGHGGQGPGGGHPVAQESGGAPHPEQAQGGGRDGGHGQGQRGCRDDGELLQDPKVAQLYLLSVSAAATASVFFLLFIFMENAKVARCSKGCVIMIS